MHFLTLLTTLLLAVTPIVATTEAKDREVGDCFFGKLTVDADGQVTGCGVPVTPISSRGDYKGLDGLL